MNHTPEPWHLHGDGVYIAAGVSPGQPYIACFTFGSHWRPAGTSEANCARAVACVNACAGMADPAAEIARLREALRNIHQYWACPPPKTLKDWSARCDVMADCARTALAEKEGA